MESRPQSPAGIDLDAARRLLLDHVSDAVAIVDARDGDFRVLECNQAMRSVGGADGDAALERAWVATFPRLNSLASTLRDVAQRRQPRSAMARPTAPGADAPRTTELGHSWRFIPSYGAAGATELIHVIGRTAHSAAESAATRLFKPASVDRLPLPALVLEGETRTIAWMNERFANVLGGSARDITGRTLTACLPEFPLNGPLARVEAVTRKQLSGPVAEGVLHLPNGDHDDGVAFAVVRLPSTDEDLAVTLVLGFEVPAPSLARQQVRESAAAALWRAGQLEAVFGAMVDGVLVLDETGLVVEANEAALAILGLPVDAESRELADYLAPLMPSGDEGRAARIGSELLAGVLAGRVLPDEQLRLVAPGGDESAVSLRGAPVRDSAGKIVGAVVVLRDVTDQHRGNQEKDAFLSVISHEVKSPLTSIKGFAQLAARSATGPHEEKIRSHVQVIEQQVARIERLINELANVDRNGDTAPREELVVFDLTGMTRAVLEQQQVTVSGHQLLFVGSAERLPILADPARIEQVLTNLIANAVKYSPESFAVTVGLERSGASAHIWVRDDGIGIPRAELGRLFDRFYRASNARRRGYGGLGLGLHVVHDIVQRNHGQIWVESDEGRGTTFHITLPLHESEGS